MAVDYNNILMVYIPRNGCTCIALKRFSTNESGENPTINSARNFKLINEGRFDSIFELKSKINVSQFNIISIVRNPYTRAYSLYRRYLKVIKFSKVEKSFKDFLYQIKNGQPYHPIARNLLHRTQTWYLINENGVIDSSIKLYNFENLSALKIDLELNTLSHSNRMRFDNESEIIAYGNSKNIQFGFEGSQTETEYVDTIKKYKSYSIEEMQQAYEQECIDLVKEIYAEDFDNFNYSRNFEDAI